jgi:hypothetical protein
LSDEPFIKFFALDKAYAYPSSLMAATVRFMHIGQSTAAAACAGSANTMANAAIATTLEMLLGKTLSSVFAWRSAASESEDSNARRVVGG